MNERCVPFVFKYKLDSVSNSSFIPIQIGTQTAMAPLFAGTDQYEQSPARVALDFRLYYHQWPIPQCAS